MSHPRLTMGLVRPVERREEREFRGRLGPRLSEPPWWPFGLALALRAGRGWTDGVAVACLAPPGRAVLAYPALLLVAGSALLVVVALPVYLLFGPALVAVLLLAVTASAGLVAGQSLSGRRARLRGPGGGGRPAAWLYCVAKPAGVPPRSAGGLLSHLCRLCDERAWPAALATTQAALVARYGELGFAVVSAPSRLSRRYLLRREPACTTGPAVPATTTATTTDLKRNSPTEVEAQ